MSSKYLDTTAEAAVVQFEYVIQISHCHVLTLGGYTCAHDPINGDWSLMTMSLTNQRPKYNPHLAFMKPHLQVVQVLRLLCPFETLLVFPCVSCRTLLHENTQAYVCPCPLLY